MGKCNVPDGPNKAVPSAYQKAQQELTENSRQQSGDKTHSISQGFGVFFS